MRRFLPAVSALGLLLLSGCAVFGPAPDPCSYPPGASSAFPSSSLQDWVTYGDHAVVLTGIDEIEQDGHEVVRLRHERTLWSRDQAPAAPPEETFADTERNYDSAAAKPGHQYLLVGTWWDWDRQHDEQPDWVHLQLLAFDNGIAGGGSDGCPPDSSEIASGRSAVWGRSEAEIADLFKQTPPESASTRFQGLEPDERWQRVAATR